jgi:hypothetical protein
MPKLLRHVTDGFTSPPKEVVLWIFIALKNPSFSAGFEPTNLRFHGKQDNHSTTEADMTRSKISGFHFSEYEDDCLLGCCTV